MAWAVLASEKHVKKPLLALFIHKTLLTLLNVLLLWCPGIIILHCPKTDVEKIKATLDNSLHTDNGMIYSIPGT